MSFLSLIGSIIFGQQVEAVLVHAYALLLGVFGKLFVKRLGKTEFELTGIGS